MSTSISDGRTQNTLKVDTNFRAHVSSVSDDTKDRAAEFGDKYNINTGDITLTDASETSLIFVKNNEDFDLVITQLTYNLGASTGGSGDVIINVIRSPTAGSIVSDAIAVEVGTGVSANLNFGSNKTLAIDAFKGDTADTVFTDGVTCILTRSAANSGRIIIELGAVVLPKGSSVGVNYTPPASNTSQIVQVAIACYLRTTDVHAEN